MVPIYPLWHFKLLSDHKMDLIFYFIFYCNEISLNFKQLATVCNLGKLSTVWVLLQGKRKGTSILRTTVLFCDFYKSYSVCEYHQIKCMKKPLQQMLKTISHFPLERGSWFAEDTACAKSRRILFCDDQPESSWKNEKTWWRI